MNLVFGWKTFFGWKTCLRMEDFLDAALPEQLTLTPEMQKKLVALKTIKTLKHHDCKH